MTKANDQTPRERMDAFLGTYAPGNDTARSELQSMLGIYDSKFSGVHTLSFDREGVRDLITASNRLFEDTPAEIQLRDSGEITNMHMLKRAALITALTGTDECRSLVEILGFPATPDQLELLLQEYDQSNGDIGLPKDPSTFWEDEAVIIYQVDREGINYQEAVALHKDVVKHREQLGLNEGDLGKPLLVVHPGLEKDAGMKKYGLKLRVIPGTTEVYTPEVLQLVHGDNKFLGYGLDYGVPKKEDVGVEGASRWLWTPSKDGNLNLGVLCRGGGRYLYAWDGDLSSSGSDGLVTMVGR